MFYRTIVKAVSFYCNYLFIYITVQRTLIHVSSNDVITLSGFDNSIYSLAYLDRQDHLTIIQGLLYLKIMLLVMKNLN